MKYIMNTQFKQHNMLLLVDMIEMREKYFDRDVYNEISNNIHAAPAAISDYVWQAKRVCLFTHLIRFGDVRE